MLFSNLVLNESPQQTLSMLPMKVGILESLGAHDDRGIRILRAKDVSIFLAVAAPIVADLGPKNRTIARLVGAKRIAFFTEYLLDDFLVHRFVGKLHRCLGTIIHRCLGNSTHRVI